MVRRGLIAVITILAITGSVHSQGLTADSTQIQRGPSIGNLRDMATVRVPFGFMFLNGDQARELLEMMENPTDGSEVGIVANDSFSCFIVFQFADCGYVRDDEKNSLDADAMLDALRQGNAQGNEERRKRGWPELRLAGWAKKPTYNEATHNLEWAIRLERDSIASINYNIRVLGRKGVMSAVLVGNPQEIMDNMTAFYSILAGFYFNEGHRYAEVREGDKIAKYGLTALVTGGATAVAAKTGLLKWLWKIIVLALAGIGAFFKKIFGGRNQRPY